MLVTSWGALVWQLAGSWAFHWESSAFRKARTYGRFFFTFFWRSRCPADFLSIVTSISHAKKDIKIHRRHTSQSHRIVWTMSLFRKKKNNNNNGIVSTLAMNQAVELGTINYVNLTSDGRHGDMEKALHVARETGKPLFCNFVEWSGWSGCKDAGAIFADPCIKRAAEEYVTAAAWRKCFKKTSWLTHSRCSLSR